MRRSAAPTPEEVDFHEARYLLETTLVDINELHSQTPPEFRREKKALERMLWSLEACKIAINTCRSAKINELLAHIIFQVKMLHASFLACESWASWSASFFYRGGRDACVTLADECQAFLIKRETIPSLYRAEILLKTKLGIFGIHQLGCVGDGLVAMLGLEPRTPAL